MPCPRVPLGSATPAYGGGVRCPSWGGVAPWVYRIRTGASSSHETSRMRRTSRRCDVQSACWRGLRSGVHRGATIFRKLSENFRGVHRNGCLHNNCQHQLIRSRSSSRQLNPFFFSLLSRPGGQPHRGSFLFGRLRCRRGGPDPSARNLWFIKGARSVWRLINDAESCGEGLCMGGEVSTSTRRLVVGVDDTVGLGCAKMRNL